MTVDIVQSNNLTALRDLGPAVGGLVRLVYLDPPFRTGKRQSGKAGAFDDHRVEIGQFTRGSGTTLAVCKRLGRIGFGIDLNPQAVKVSKARVEAIAG
jgi:hypothetical protein